MTILSYLPLVLQVVLLWLLLRRKGFSSFPWFFAYTLFSILATSARFAFRNSRAIYAPLYWTTDALYVLFGVAVLFEVLGRILGRRSRSRGLMGALAGLALLAMAMTYTRVRHPLSGMGDFAQTVLAAELGVRFLQVLLFIFLLVLAALHGLRWRQPAFGICAGYGIYASVNLLTTTKYYEFGTGFTYLWGWVSVITYTMAVLIWILFFTSPIEEAKTLRGDGPPLSPQELERYKEIVRRVERP